MIRRWLLALAGVLVLVLPSAALAHDPRDDRPKRGMSTAGTNVPLVTSPNLRFVGNFPETQGISGEFAKSGHYFYLSSLEASACSTPRTRCGLG